MSARVRTGVAGLDDMLCGGFVEGSSVLLAGAPGTGKTTFGLQFLYTGIVQEDEPGLLITFEEFPQSLMRDAQVHNWDLRALEEANKLRIIFTSPQILISNLQLPNSPISHIIRDWGVRRIVLDSIDHLSRITRDPVELRHTYNAVINALKREKLTSVLTREAGMAQPLHNGDMLAYAVDAVLMMRYVEIDSAMQRAIMVLKMRGSAHAQGIHRFEIRTGGLAVTGPFEGLRGLLTGMPSRTAQRHK